MVSSLSLTAAISGVAAVAIPVVKVLVCTAFGLFGG